MYLLLHCVMMTGLLSPVQAPAPPAPGQVQLGLEFLDEVQGEAKAPTSLEQAISQALVNHPDMRLVEAELRVAEAKLAQARIVVSQKVTEDFHRMEKERADVELAKAKFDRVNQLYKKNFTSTTEVQAAQNDLASAKARLAATESSWKLMLGKQLSQTKGDQSLMLGRYLDARLQLADVNAAQGFYRVYYQIQPDSLHSRAALHLTGVGTAGSIEQLKTHLEVKVKLEKQTNLYLDQAFKKVTDGAGLKIRVKLPITENKTIYPEVTRFDMDANEYPLHTWLQLIVDEMNSFQALALAASQRKEIPKRYDLYVREYGLLLTSHDLAPPDAITVQELLKQIKYEKAAKVTKKAQESEAPKK